MIADVTYGNDTFWKQISENRYPVRATDINSDRSRSTDHGVDYRDLPYEDGEIDVVVLDSPFRSGLYDGGHEIEDSPFWIEDRYASPTDCELTYHDAVLNEYAVDGREARGVLSEDGTLIIKVQDEVSMNEQHLTQTEVLRFINRNWDSPPRTCLFSSDLTPPRPPPSNGNGGRGRTTPTSWSSPDPDRPDCLVP